ncbi:MAG: glutamyl-tRNA reductase [Clostridia bacterium]|nr:glutamyl-tRNA reductase [Clostridia bacterium]
MFIAVTGLNHRTATVEIREKLAYSTHSLPAALRDLKNRPGIEGCVILSTCNRTEVCTAAASQKAALEEAAGFLSERCGLSSEELKNYLYNYTMADAVRHLFRVAAGLDSMILGEAQVLAQVKEAYELALAAGATNGVLNTLWQQAIMVGKRVRTETKIDHNTVSISYAAVELARQVFGELRGRSVLVIGAGKMSTLAAKYLKSNGVTTVLVSNRSFEKAKALAEEIGGQAFRLDALAEILPAADIVISCTAASHFILRASQVQAALEQRGGRPLMLIDIAVPRDIEPATGELPGASLYDIDDLQQVVLNNLTERQKAANQAEKIIEEEVHAFLRYLGSLNVVPTITALKEKAEYIKRAELARAFNRLGPLSEREKKIIGSLANSIVNQLLHEPIIALKAMAATPEGPLYNQALQRLFNLQTSAAEPAERLVKRGGEI